jgi:AcrR family transcriptional regulator
MRDPATKTTRLEEGTAPVRQGRRDDILDMAGRMFRERGYHATSMRDLAKALDLRGSSLYAHFAAKEDVLWEIVMRAAAAFESAIEAVPDDLPPRARLSAMITAHLAVVADELATATVFFQDWLHLAPDRRSRMVAVRDAYQQRFVAVIEEGRSQGVFRVADPRMAALIVLSALNWSYQWLDPSGRLDLAEVATAYVQQVLDGVSAQSGGSDTTDVMAVGGRASVPVGGPATGPARTLAGVR